MKKISLPPGPPEDTFAGAGPAKVERVRARAREIALLAGRPLGHVLPVDFEQAKRELLGTRSTRPNRKPRE